ncbi:MAG: hypothetical protein LRZ92_00050 [Methanosarcinaceae archaeon]|nr:hypothetical protein [Methanosarcinaceae archaeon]
MLNTLSKIIDRSVENYNIKLEYIETSLDDTSFYINAFSASKRAEIYIKAPTYFAKFLVLHELAHLKYIDYIIAAHREVSHSEKISDRNFFLGFHIDEEVIHFAINLISNYTINLDFDMTQFKPHNDLLLNSLPPQMKRDAYLTTALILFSRHSIDAVEDETFNIIHRYDKFNECKYFIKEGSNNLIQKRFKAFIKSIMELSEVLNNAFLRSDKKVWEEMAKNTDLLHEHSPISLKEEKASEFSKETLTQKVAGKSIGCGVDEFIFCENDLFYSKSLKLPNLIGTGLGIEKPKLIKRFRNNISLSDKKRIVFFESRNRWLERERVEHDTVWIIIDASNSMMEYMISAKIIANTLHKYFKKKTKIIAFATYSKEISIEDLTKIKAKGGTNISSVINFTKNYKREPVAIVSDFKFIQSHFDDFLIEIVSKKPEAVLFLPIDQKSMIRVNKLIEKWSGLFKYSVL